MMNKTFLFGAASILLYYLGKKGKDLYNELNDSEKISVGITNFGTPSLSKGTIAIPLGLKLLNATSLAVKVEDLLTKVYTINKQGVKTLLFQNTPEGIRGLNIKPNATTNIKVNLTGFLSNLIFSSLSLLQTKQILIEVYPKIAGISLPKQEILIPFNYFNRKR